MSETMTAPAKLREHVAEEVRVLLVRRKMTGSGLAAAMGKSEMYVSRRLRGETAFDLDDLEEIARALRVTPADLLPKRGATEGYQGEPLKRQVETGARKSRGGGRPLKYPSEKSAPRSQSGRPPSYPHDSRRPTLMRHR